MEQNQCQKPTMYNQQLQQKENLQQPGIKDECAIPRKTQFAFSFSGGDKVDAELRKPRSRAYMEVFDVIDMLSTTDEEIIEQLKANMDEETAEEFAGMSAEEILAEIRECFQEEFQNLPIEVKSVLHGVLAKCYISGCDCHAISAEGKIIEHYDMKQEMPDELQKGRIVFRKFPDCRCVEVYNDCCRVIGYDATVTKIKNSEI